MNIKDRLLTPGKEHGRTGQLLQPKGIVVHYVGNPGSSAESNRNWFENGAGGAYTSAHYIIGLTGEILRLIPENERAQHAGKSYASMYDAMAKSNNGTYIGIECCHPDAGGQFNEKTTEALVEICTEICRQYAFNPASDVKRHFDVTGKMCPLYYINNASAWTHLVNDVAAGLNEVPGMAMPTLRRGDCGEAVKELQLSLSTAGFPLSYDGQFGPETENAVKAYQTSHGLCADGICGPKTWAALRTAQPPSEPVRSPNEITVDDALADGVITDRVYWLGVLEGVVRPSPEYIRTLLSRYHTRLAGCK